MQQRKSEAPMGTEEQLAVLETTMRSINAVLIDMRNDNKHLFDKLDTKIDSFRKEVRHQFKTIDEKFEAIDKRFSYFDRKFERLEDRWWSGFRWVMGTIFGLAALTAHGFHWF